MKPGTIRTAIVAERIAWIRTMLDAVETLPLGSEEEFMSDPRNAAAAESYVRRALEALMDLGRHILSKGFAVVATEYKDIATQLHRAKVLSDAEAIQLRRLAGYRNRLVHFYHEVSHRELYEICTVHVRDIEVLLGCLLDWLRAHPERTDTPIIEP